MFILGNYLQMLSKTGHLYQIKKESLIDSFNHNTVIHAITFYGTLVVISTCLVLSKLSQCMLVKRF